MIEKNSLNILLVDDEPEIRELLAELFSDQGAQVWTAQNGSEASILLRQQDFDVVFSDLNMPGGSGAELMTDIRTYYSSRSRPQPRLFVFSGYNSMTEEQSKNWGVVEFFEKPFKIEKVLRAVFGSKA